MRPSSRPVSLPQRRSMRHPSWDYRAPGAYFITICTYARQYLFSNALFGQIAAAKWAALPFKKRVVELHLDEWVIMPNHVHMILHLDSEIVFQRLDGARPRSRCLSGSVGAIIGGYKSSVTGSINIQRNTPGAAVWHRGYWDRIIRNEAELGRIRQYIRDNPRRWREDGRRLDRILSRMTYHPYP